MAARTPWTPEDEARMVELHKAGKSLTFIAKELVRSTQTISRYSKMLGLEWDRTHTAKAAEAVHVDNKARRVLLEARLLEEADDILDQLWDKSVVFSFGGSENTYNEHTLNKPTYPDQKAIMQSASTAISAAAKLHEVTSGSSSDHSKSMLLQMQEALLKAVSPETPTASPEPGSVEAEGESGATS